MNCLLNQNLPGYVGKQYKSQKNKKLKREYIFLNDFNFQVRYLHDGSESLQDSITLELELAPGAGFVLPGYLQGTHRFVLHVDITPINDSPVLVISASKVLRLAQVTS